MVKCEKKIYSDEDRKKLREQLFQIGCSDTSKNIFYSIKSHYKILYIVSSEEDRVITFFQKFCISEGYRGYIWDCSRGLIDIHNDEGITTDREDIKEPEAVLSYIIDATKKPDDDKSDETKGKIYLLLDFHKFLEDADAIIERKLKEFSFESEIDSIVIVAPEFICGNTIEKEVTMIDFPYPSKNELDAILKEMMDGVRIKKPKLVSEVKNKKEDLIHAMTGMTLREAKNALAKTIVKDNEFRISTLIREKELTVKKSGILEICNPQITMDDVGGLENLKQWLAVRKNGFCDDAREFGLPVVKGVLLTGIPGCVLGNTKIKVKKVSEEGKHEIIDEQHGSSKETSMKHTEFIQISQEKETTIEEFFSLCENEGIYQIDTPDGWRDIEFLIKKKNKESYNLVLENKELGCSCDHYILTKNGWKKAEDIDVENDYVCTKDGEKRVVANEYLGNRDTFDLGVRSPEHRYYSNDVISHNTGKSFTVKAVADFYQVPLLRLDMGSIFSSRVGDSEARIRSVIKTVDSIAPCICWLDEVEKGLSGVSSSGQTDGGTTARVVSTLLTWMQEKQSSVFIMATANNISDIPPEFMRAGRFDEIFFLDMPNEFERTDIIGKLLKRKKRNPDEFDLTKIAKVCDTYVGAEIEKAIDNALFTCYCEDKRKLTEDDVIKEFERFIPLYKSRQDEINVMRQWAKDGGAIFANSLIIPKSKTTRNKPVVSKLDFDDIREEIEI